jgi:hypothetical protein
MVIVWDDCDAAILGHTLDLRVVYCYDRLVSVFVGQGMTKEEANDWVNFNIVGTYVGENTPIIVYPATRADIDEAAEIVRQVRERFDAIKERDDGKNTLQ